MGNSASKTPAPLKDRVKGSRTNKAGSAASKKSAQGIKLNASIIAGLTKKAKEYNEKHPKGKVSVTTLKAVMRRGMGAYSSSHRPTITGGAPNTRQAWAYARVNAFLRKKGGQGAKPTYVQDNDLLENGGTIESFKKVKETHLGTDQSFEVVEYKYKEATIYYSNLDKLWVLAMQKNDKPYKIIGSYKTLKSAKEVGLYYLNNPNLYAHGGQLGKEITCVNCGWHWNTNDSDPSDKYVCHKCGYDNRTYYDSEPIGKMADGGLVAPNGKKSNLTPEQYKLVRTPEFKAWFGDWENDSENASKVVDENGEPLVVYHGTEYKFNEFDINKSKFGFFFTNSYDLALTYDKNVYQFFLDIKKPRKKDFKGANYDGDYQLKDYSVRNIGYDTKTFASISHPNTGYNGAIMKNVMDIGEGGWNENLKPSNIYVVFNSNQIKLADGTNKTFDMNNPDIRYAHGGLTKTLAVADIHKKYPELPKKYINAQLYIGMRAEMEHTKNPDVAKKIALDHLNESPFYYGYLTKMEKQLEGLDVKKHYQEVKGYAKGGEINPDNKGVKDYFAHGSGNVGGVLVGKRHSEGGIKAVNKSTNQPLEMEGGEVVITRNAVSDNEKREFEGEMLTNREILSRINESGGGVSFADGGDIPESINTSGKEYAYGGKMVKDHDIVSSCGCKHTMAEGGKIYGQGGVVSMFDKEIPTYVAFQELFNGLKLPNLRKEYEGFLKENYKINFTQLPQKVRTGLLLGSQKLIDNYINK